MAETTPSVEADLPTPERLRWVLVAYGTAAFFPACLLLALLLSGGRQLGKVFLHFVAVPDPFPVAIGYGLGYLIVQYRVRNRRPSFLQSQIFAGCVYLGMFISFVLCSIVFSRGPLAHASAVAVTLVLVPTKLLAGGAVGAALYPFMASKRLSSRYASPTPILPKYASPPPAETELGGIPTRADGGPARRPAARGSARSRGRSRRR